MNHYIVKKEFKEGLYESKGLWMMVAAACILSGLCILVVNMKEGTSLAQNDVLQYAIKATMFITLTITMVLGSSSFVSEREENTLESLLLTPISKLSLTLAKYCGVLVIGLALYVISSPYLVSIGYGTGITGSALLIMFFSGVILLLAFVAISIVMSIILQSSRASILTSVLILIIMTFPAFVQGLFKLSAVGRALLAIDPVACAFNMMNAMLIKQTPFMSLGNYILPLIVFIVISFVLLVWASKKVALKGEN